MKSTIKEACPECRSENIFFSRKIGKYRCEDCEAVFDKPCDMPAGTEADMHGIATDIPKVDTRCAEVFLASSVALKVQRDMISAVAAEGNGCDFSVYIKLYHCEDDDAIDRTQTQQESYNRKIAACDVFALIIDGGELGAITAEEIMLAAKHKHSCGIKMAAFVREGSSGNERNIRWKNFISENRGLFDFYCTYEKTSEIPALAESLCNEIRHDGSIGTLTEGCARYAYNVLLTGTDEFSDEFVYAIADKFNTENNRRFEADPRNSLIFRVLMTSRTKRGTQGKDHFFVIHRRNDKVIEMIKTCFDKNDINIDISVFEDRSEPETESLVRLISEEIGGRYLYMFSDRNSLVNKGSFSGRIDSIQSAYDKLLEGVRLFEEGNYYKAEPLLINAADTGFDEACLYLGYIYCDKEKPSFYDEEKAEKYFRIAADRGVTAAQYNLGVVLYARNRRDEAEKYYRMAADRGYRTAQYNLGNLFKEQHRYDEAEKYYRMAADREYTDAQVNLGVLLEEQKRLDEAERYYQMAADSGNVNGQINLGNIYYEQNMLAEAELYYRLAAESGIAAAQYNLANLLKRRGRLDAAEMYYRMAADSGNTTCQNTLGIFYKEQQRFREAEKYWRMAADNGDPDAQYNLGFLFIEQQRHEEAEKYLLMAANNGDTDAMCNLGILCMNCRRYKDAEKYLRAAADMGDVNAFGRLGTLFYTIGKGDEAEKYYRIAADMGDIGAGCILGLILAKRQQLDEAEKYWKISADSGNTHAQCDIGILYYKQRRYVEAEKYLRMAAENGSADALRYLENLP